MNKMTMMESNKNNNKKEGKKHLYEKLKLNKEEKQK